MALTSLNIWINSEFLEAILNSGQQKKSKILSKRVEKATALGITSSSHVYRVSLHISKDGVQEYKSLIVKVEPCNADTEKFTDKANLFKREVDVFTLVIRNAEKLLQDHARGKYLPYAPKCFYTYIGPPSSVIVMEDLKESGFRQAKHSGGLDINHCLLAINTLASYHAASVVLYTKDPKTMQLFKTSLYTESMKRTLKKLFDPTLRRIAFEANTWPECEGEIASKLQELAYFHSFDQILDCLKTDERDFRVLAHEDICLDNIMFRYPKGSKIPTDVRYIDFQFSHWTSPVIDLSYFINANCSVDFALQPQILIEEYHKKLLETLTTLRHSHLCPSKEYLYDQYNKRCKFGIMLGLVVRSYILKECSEVNGNEVECRSEKCSSFSVTYVKDLKKMLPYFHQRGWL